MCKSKAQGGQRCFPHAASQLARAQAAHARVAATHKANKAAHADAVRADDNLAIAKTERKLARSEEQLGKAKGKEHDAQVSYASTPTGREVMKQQVRDFKAAGKRQAAIDNLRDIRAGIRQNQDAKEQYKEWRETQPKGGSMTVRTEGDIRVAYATGKGEPSPLPEGIANARAASEALAAPAAARREATVDEDVVAHRSVSDAYEQFNGRVNDVEQRMVKHLSARENNMARGYQSWRDERTGQGVDLTGGTNYSDWDKDRVDAHLTSIISARTGADPETTKKLISDYQDCASVKSYSGGGLKSMGLKASQYATTTKVDRVAVGRNAHATVTPNEHSTHAVLSHGQRHYAAMNASVDAVEKNWDTMNDDEKIRSYLSLRETSANLRDTRDSIEDRVTAKVQANPTVTYSKSWGVKTADRPYTKFPDKPATHEAIRAKIAEDHAKSGGDQAQARAVLDLYGSAAQFNNPKKRGMSARGLDPDAHSQSVFGRSRIVYNEATETRAAS